MAQEFTARDLERHVYDHRIESIVGHFGHGYHRQIDYLVGTAEYVVLDHREQVWSGRSADEAIEAYEKIQPR